MGVSTISSPTKMTIDQFYDFVEARPDGEKWELIDGEPVLSPSAAFRHQIVVANILYHLESAALRLSAPWIPVPGTAVIAPDDIYNAPVPDVMVAPGTDPESWKTMDSLAVFEVLSPSNRAMDLRRKPAIYARSPTIGDYLILDAKRVKLVHYARGTGWQPRIIADIEAAVTIEALGVELPLATAYRRTGLVPSRS